jgi:hypothetical protein
MLAKGKVFVSKEKLSELLSLPEGVELIAVKVNQSDEGYEFLVMSAEETVCTKKNVGMNLLRRTSVDTLEHFNKSRENRGGIISSGSISISSIPFPEVGLRNHEVVISHKDFEELSNVVDEVMESLSKKEKTVEEDVLKIAQKKGNF